jgi:ABC-type branched-subunit amino acid transport system substrate-binding protein
VTIDRRRFLAAAGAAVVAGCSGRRRARPAPRSVSRPPAPSGPGTPFTVGVVAPFSGPYAAVGQVVSAAMVATSRHIDADLGGSFEGYRPVFTTADAPLTSDDGRRAYSDLVRRRVDAIAWCGSPGLVESLPDIVADLVPVIAAGTDLQTRVFDDKRVPDLTTKDAAGFPVFQTSLADFGAIDVLVDYARTDRRFDRLALVYSTNGSPSANHAFDRACTTRGVTNVAEAGFDSTTGPPDLTATVARLKETRAQAVVVVGAAPDAVALVGALDAAGARYVDTPTAKGAGFAPMVLGVPGATATAVFARGAGTHAAKGTVAASLLDGVVGLPGSSMRDWVRRFSPGYNGGLPQGGEQGLADAVAAFLTAAAVARSTAAPDIIAGLESGVPIQFSTGRSFHFGPDRHLSSAVDDDVCLQALEYQPEPRYNLGRDWGTVFPLGYRAMDLLVDYSRRNRPGLQLDAVVAARYGLSSAYQDGNAARAAAFSAVH